MDKFHISKETLRTIKPEQFIKLLIEKKILEKYTPQYTKTKGQPIIPAKLDDCFHNVYHENSYYNISSEYVNRIFALMYQEIKNASSKKYTSYLNHLEVIEMNCITKDDYIGLYKNELSKITKSINVHSHSEFKHLKNKELIDWSSTIKNIIEQKYNPISYMYTGRLDDSNLAISIADLRFSYSIIKYLKANLYLYLEPEKLDNEGVFIGAEERKIFDKCVKKFISIYKNFSEQDATSFYSMFKEKSFIKDGITDNLFLDYLNKILSKCNLKAASRMRIKNNVSKKYHDIYDKVK